VLNALKFLFNRGDARAHDLYAHDAHASDPYAHDAHAHASDPYGRDAHVHDPYARDAHVHDLYARDPCEFFHFHDGHDVFIQFNHHYHPKNVFNLLFHQFSHAICVHACDVIIQLQHHCLE
jgi:hypothetical protein